jgi:hypothetical protein
MSKQIRKTRAGRHEYKGQIRAEHWYVDNQVYFISARCEQRFPAFASDPAASDASPLISCFWGIRKDT